MTTSDAAEVGAANATFSATLVDQWIVNGLTHAFIAPGSRSTPLAVALAERPEVRLEVFLDERSASFAALGYGQATSKPAVVLCTSGTAATHFHGAVAEAGISCVPMLVCTANRPPELWGIGAPQTIDQTNLYAASVRAFLQPGPPDDGHQDTWRSLANQSWAAAASPAEPGPVQLDLSFREPLVGATTSLPAPLRPAVLKSSPGPSESRISKFVGYLLHDNRPLPGVIVAGRGQSNPAAIRSLAHALGWPVIADHRSGLRDGTSLRFTDTF
ncbi:MAG: 2-succinyl-5-enolpyruvyl-6-hydroxy-3-cyclohexene-1-carboxylic-acid synthase, partial [Acidimicrobiales bacterium]|nr:2-succinyl-5-enolpyruvyl-6-hydroxy-3-cyclohexene-1-carboxylic-acid synthase [Acidimicrobiales bacterium]